MNKGLYSSNTPEYTTPIELYKKLDEEFNFTLDPCCTNENHKCSVYYTKEVNGLKMRWNGRVFMNPPYGRVIGLWIKKAYESVLNKECELVVCLVPARTDTKWFQDYCLKSSDIRWIRGRVKFANNSPAPFPSCIVVFK